MPTGLRTCADCGATSSVAGDLCPACLFRLALCGADESAPDGWFGPYRVVRMIGEGGMGRVYLAEQREPIQRRAAIKVIKLGMDTESFIARFQSERQALAMLDHPGIARIYDAGSTPDGRPYFAMEYVEDAVPLTEFCDRRRLGVRERLALFVQICAAVHHAHAHGIVHRDLKPSNVLVATRDGAPAAKVIDFGVAKAAKPSPGGIAATMFTEEGVLIGTPEYMSPEQATSADAAVDARADVYSLGVLLYELASGVLPFAKPIRSGGYYDLVRRIREEEAVSPVQRLQALAVERVDELAALRGADARALVRELRGDLEWIALRAMRKEPELRYASAAELGDDVQRHLDSEPVKAGPPSLQYRARKFVSKYKTACVALAAVLAVAAIATLAALALQRRAIVAARTASEDGYIAALHAAELHLAAGDPDAARAELAKCEQRRRGWEWDYLMYRTDPSLATIPAGGSFAGRESTPSFGSRRDGRQFWHTDTSIEEWGGAAPPLSRPAPGRVMALNAAATVCAVLDGKGSLGIHSLGTLALLRRIDTGGVVVRTAFDRAGRTLAVALAGGRVEIRDARSGDLLRTVVERGPEIRDIRMNPEGTKVAFSDESRTVRVTETRPGSPIKTITERAAAGGRLALMIRGVWLIASLYDPEAPEQAGAGLFGIGTGELLRIYRSRDPIADLAFHPAGMSEYAFVSTTGEVQVCTGSAGCTVVRRVASEPANSVGFSGDGRLMYTGVGGRSPGVAVWDADSMAGTLIPGPNTPYGLAFDRSGTRVLATLLDQVDAVELWSLHHGVEKVWGVHPAPMHALAASGDRSVFATGGNDGAVRIWHASGEELAGPGRVPGPVSALALDDRGEQLAVAAADGNVRLWDRSRNVFRAQLPVAGARAIAFRPDGAVLAVAARDGATVLYARNLGVVHRTNLPRAAAATSVAWSADGALFAAGDSTGAIHVRRADATDVVLRGHSGPVLSVAFHPGGSRIASGSEDRTVRVWDVSSAKTLLTLVGNNSPVHTVAWSPDGETLVTAGKTARLWETRRGALRQAGLSATP